MSSSLPSDILVQFWLERLPARVIFACGESILRAGFFFVALAVRFLVFEVLLILGSIPARQFSRDDQAIGLFNIAAKKVRVGFSFL